MNPKHFAALGLMTAFLLAPAATHAADTAAVVDKAADALTANKVQDAMSAGVRFVACGNSMQAQHLTKDDMIDGIAYAKAGYVEIMRLQQQGWTYIRP
jgi:intracellular sulfur oxidation DsrE/DsrF family protein